MAWVFSLILHNMERRIRKLIRVSAITVGALLFTGFVVVAFVINYVFTPDKLTPIVLNVANRSFNTFYSKDTHRTLSDYKPNQKSKVIFEHGTHEYPTKHIWAWFHGKDQSKETFYQYSKGKWYRLNTD